MFLYQRIEDFAARYPDVITVAAKKENAPAKKKVWRQGKRASRRVRGEEAVASLIGGDDDSGSGSGSGSDEDDSADDDEAGARSGDTESGASGAQGGDDGGDDNHSGNGTFDSEAYTQEMEFLKGLGLADEEIDERNPLHKKSYYEIPARTRLVILKSLCDFQLETYDDETSKDHRDFKLLRDGKLEPDDLRVEPFADDRDENLFWYFDCGSRVYRETRADQSPKSRRGASKLITLPAQKWEAVACTIEELEAFLGKLKKKKHKSEVDLRKALDEILDDWKGNCI